MVMTKNINLIVIPQFIKRCYKLIRIFTYFINMRQPLTNMVKNKILDVLSY